MRIPTLLCVLLLGASPALAEVPEVSTGSPSSGPTVRAQSTTTPIALGVNLPLRWGDADSVAASLYVGLTKHHAIRANVASYANHGNLTGDLISLASGGEGNEGIYRGRTTDVGVAWVDYSRGLWDGFTYEVGLLYRARDVSEQDEFVTPEVTAAKTRTVAGRLMIGWSWLMYGHVFLSVAIGGSAGYERGTESTERLAGAMRTTTDVSRPTYAGEGYLRIGWAFGR